MKLFPQVSAAEGDRLSRLPSTPLCHAACNAVRSQGAEPEDIQTRTVLDREQRSRVAAPRSSRAGVEPERSQVLEAKCFLLDFFFTPCVRELTQSRGEERESVSSQDPGLRVLPPHFRTSGASSHKPFDVVQFQLSRL